MTGIVSMARQGRNGDTRMAHTTPGEYVIPREVVATRPDLIAHVAEGIRRMGGDPRRYQVGSGRRNPATGAEEFASQDEIVAAYESQLGRTPNADEIGYWANDANNFAGGSFAQGVAAEKAASASPGIVESAGGPSPAPAPKPSAGAFTAGLKQQYRDLLGRDMDTAGDKYWSNLDANTNQTDAELQAQFNAGVAAELAGRAKPPPAPSAPAAAPSAAQLGTPTPWNVTPEQTVEGRITSILNPNNPIIQQARARANMAANNSGLLNSSIATTAADAAAYDAAIPIAQADAATAAKAAGYNADQSNQFAVKNTDYQNQFGLQFGLQQMQNDTQLGLQRMQNESQLAIAQLNSETQKTIAKLNNDSQDKANKVQLDNQTLLQTNSNAAQAFSTAMSAINNITNNAQMDGDTKTRATADVWNNLQTQLRVLGNVAGIDLTKQLNFAGYPGFDAKGNFVGFEDGPGAVTKGAAPAPSPSPTPAPAEGGGSGYSGAGT